ncbi:MAG: hypothetical protein E2O44_00600 [Nitrospina sp.]|nr:MAG: hypothetical protein E2O44_00600 [Nitrospina sp.]TDJ58118.1 MAG: hypothetical protein E2O41_06760 [Nitrospina sp.]
MKRWPFLLVAILCIPLSGCLTTFGASSDRSDTTGGHELDKVFKASMSKTDRAVRKVLKARKLKIKGIKEDKKIKEIFVSSGGTKVTIILEKVGLQTQVTVSAKKSRFFTDIDTARAILNEIGANLAVKKSKKAHKKKKKSTPPGLTS